MRIIISPAKKMRRDTDSFPCCGYPIFLDKTEQILSKMRLMSRDELKALWKCNDQITDLNYRRIQEMDLRMGLTPAVLAYEGIQYRYMAPGVFSAQAFTYLQEHLRILSGFYGLLRPFDGVVPYRLEMQAKLAVSGSRDLYNFWFDSIAKQLLSETDCILNLASKEYSSCISPYLSDGNSMITCVFGEEHKGKILEKGTLCKMARGEMVRFLAENQITDPKNMKEFEALGYRFDRTCSDDSTYVYIRAKEEKQ